MKITLCGSIGFYKEMEGVRDKLKELGHEVKIPQLFLEASSEFGGETKIHFTKHIKKKGMGAFPVGHKIWDQKERAINDHFLKIDWCDLILVVNEDKKGFLGYVGGNTLIEIGVAFYLKKPIYILNPIFSELSYKQEILGMKPTILYGDLNLIK